MLKSFSSTLSKAKSFSKRSIPQNARKLGVYSTSQNQSVDSIVPSKTWDLDGNAKIISLKSVFTNHNARGFSQKNEPASSKSSNLESEPGYMAMDGNEAAAYIAYALTENTFLYPITPSSTMGEHVDQWASEGKLNIFGDPVSIDMLQSEGGAAGAVHGSLSNGNLTTTFTSSQGLLLKIPNMYAIAGELSPAVIHVASRALTKQAISIHGDHQDVMACRQTGWAMLCSSSVQECMDFALVSHIATLKTRIPFMHFYDGMRTSHKISKIKVIPYEDIKTIFPEKEMQENLRRLELNPVKPIMRGVGHRPDIFFQGNMAAHKYYLEAVPIIEKVFKEVESITGRKYGFFDYFGHPEAEKIIIALGSSTNSIRETVDYLNEQGGKVGSISVRLFRPWSIEHLLKAIPKSVTKIAVLDRCREEGAVGHPLYLDVIGSLFEHRDKINIIGGQYGVSAKEFTPAMIKGVFDHLATKNPRNNFTIGIDDDVTHSSIPYGKEFKTIPKGTIQCIFWGLGSDGTIGANKAAIKTIAHNTKLKVQGYFNYDAYKTDGTTVSYLRFGPNRITSEYKIMSDADFISCNKNTYVHKYDMVDTLKDGGIFLLNSKWNTLDALEQNLPNKLKRTIAQKNAKFYNIDATSIAMEVGLGRRINNVMQAAFYKLSGVLPIQDALNLLKNDIEKLYKSKGPETILKNVNAVDKTFESLNEIPYPNEQWAKLEDEPIIDNPNIPDFVKTTAKALLSWKGDSLPVSAFEPGGFFYEPNTTRYEKRAIASIVPQWIPENCTQCNICSLACPHAVIRPFLFNKNEMKSAPEGLPALKAITAELSGYNYSILISPFDCTGCSVCKEACPTNALKMVPIDEVKENHDKFWNYAIGLKKKKNMIDKYSIKGSQFEEPLFEFHGACAGCGETAYIKLATQLFGERMVMANATGCTRVYSSTFPHNPYCVDSISGKGVAYGHSLFEDNAEYGFGMVRAYETRRVNLQRKVNDLIPQLQKNPEVTGFSELAKELDLWLKTASNVDSSDEQHQKIVKILETIPEEEFKKYPFLERLRTNVDTIIKRSFWFLGGDGWAYDIGYGGLDHVLTSKSNFNILVVDTESYSNTGGHPSKATQIGASTLFNLQGKKDFKKDLGLIAMTYENAYVASISLGADYKQAVQAFKEAESYDGPSLIMALSPCINWGLPDMKDSIQAEKVAVESGYWPLYRYDPRKKEKKFVFDSKKIKKDVSEFLNLQQRFAKLKRESPQAAKLLQNNLKEHVIHKNDVYNQMAMDDFEHLTYLKKKLGEIAGEKFLILYGSETGNAQTLAETLQTDLKRRGIRAPCMAMDDYNFEELPNENNIIAITSTVGQGAFPANCRQFMHSLQSVSNDYLKGTKFAVFGLGDSSYYSYNKASEIFYKRMIDVGSEPLVRRGMGDDKADDKYEKGWEEWRPELFTNAHLPPASDKLDEASFALTYHEDKEYKLQEMEYLPQGSHRIPLVKNILMTPKDHPREFRNLQFDTSKTGWNYIPGDCLAVYPENNEKKVQEFMKELGLEESTLIDIHEIANKKKMIPSPIRLNSLFIKVLDIFGRPNKLFFESMALGAGDLEEKKYLTYLVSTEGKDEFAKIREITVDYSDALKQFPSTVHTLEYLIDFIPIIKPSLYSIASSQEMMGNKLDLCLLNDDQNIPFGRHKYGSPSHYLANLIPNKSQVTAKLQEGGCSFPETLESPLVFVGIETGIAPIRAAIQERAMAKKRGEQIGPIYIYYGARNLSHENLYGNEMEAYLQEGLITQIKNTSKDQEGKIYVQNKMKEDFETLYELLVKQKGYLYICGNIRGNDVTNAIGEMLMKEGSMVRTKANSYIEEMKRDQRLVIETY